MVSGCVGFFRTFALTLGPSRSGRSFSCAKFQVSFKWSTDPATACLRALSSVYHRSLTGGAIERNALFRRLARETARVPVANLPGHLDRSDARRKTG